MRVVCNVVDCKNWSKTGGDYAGCGGCALDEITITDVETMSGFVPVCEGFEERSGAENDGMGV